MQVPPIRVALLDDHLILLDVLAARIAMQPDMQVVCTSATGEDGLRDILAAKPDVAVMDVELPGRGAFDVAGEILQREPRTRILFLTGYLSDVLLEQAVRLNAAGYLLKGEPVEFLIDAIRRVAAGETCYSNQVQARLVAIAPMQTHALHAAHPLAGLTNRQLEVLKHLARGESVKEVARLMHISQKSVDSHKYRIMHKLGIHDRVELARYAIREGLITP